MSRIPPVVRDTLESGFHSVPKGHGRMALWAGNHQQTICHQPRRKRTQQWHLVFKCEVFDEFNAGHKIDGIGGTPLADICVVTPARRANC